MARINYTEEQKHEALELYEQLKNAKAVAELTGIHHQTVCRWVSISKAEKQPKASADKEINPNLLRLAGGNDLTAYVGRDITQMQPREIWDFLRLLNVKGDFKIEQTIHL